MKPSNEAARPAVVNALQLQFSYDGFTFRLLQRAGNAALFSKAKESHSRQSFEVVVVQKHPARTFPSGKSYPDREAMPRSEDWGTFGWSYSDLEQAQKRFNQLVESAPNTASNTTPFPASAFSRRTRSVATGRNRDDGGSYFAGFLLRHQRIGTRGRLTCSGRVHFLIATEAVDR